MIKTYTYKLLPNKRTERKFGIWIGVCRYVYNIAKEVKEESYRKGLKLSNYDLQKQMTEAKSENKWLFDVHSDTLISMLDQLDSGYKKFFSDLKKGIKTSKPKWMSKKKQKSIPFKSIKIKNDSFVLPKFGKVKVFKFKEPKGKLRTARIVKEADGLYLKVVVKTQDTTQKRESQSICAVDMGVKYFLVTSDGEFINNPKHLFKKLEKLRIEQRRLSRMKKFGSNWSKQVKIIQRLHLKVRRCRLDFLQKESSKLAKLYDTIIIEDLSIREMSKNTKLSKHILDCSWGTFFELLNYKLNLIKVAPNYSSQECSKCGYISKENRKTQSLFECLKCGFSENADYQASLNLLNRGHSVLEANVDQ